MTNTTPKQQTAETNEVEPSYTTESIDDLHELLQRAGNWVEDDVGSDVMAAEFRDGAEFVEEELLVGDGTDD